MSLYTDDQCVNEIGLTGPLAADGSYVFSAVTAAVATFQSILHPVSPNVEYFNIGSESRVLQI